MKIILVLLLACFCYGREEKVGVKNDIDLQFLTNDEGEHTRHKRNFFEKAFEAADFTEENVVNKVKFMLYTRSNPVIHQLMSLNSSHLPSSSVFDINKKVKIVIPGWTNTFISPFPVNVKNAYVTKYDVNVVIVDWSPISRLMYTKARSGVPSVGKVVAKFINLLFDYGVEASQIHVIGHSLGAHVAGIAGLNVRHLLPRITGLDPAKPMFSMEEDERLKNTSAAFVDVVHTCGLFLGFFTPLGHVDFYPNRGIPIQPGCGIDYSGLCSHRRAFAFFAESILSEEIFMSVPCNDWSLFTSGNCSQTSAIPMGEYVPTSARGVYYLTTKEKAPFGHDRIVL